MSTRFEDQLRVALREQADAAPDTYDPYARVTEGIVRDTKRRRTIAVGGTVAAVAAATVLGAAALRGLGPSEAMVPAGPSTAQTAQDSTTQAGISPAMTADVMLWPARGPLASDTTVTDGVAGRFGPEARLLYGNDSVSGSRVLLVAVPSLDPAFQAELILLSGEPGTAVADLAQRASSTLIEQPVVAVLQSGTGFELLALVPPGQRTPLVVSSPVLEAAPGSSSLQQSIDLGQDGTAVVPLADPMLPRIVIGDDAWSPRANSSSLRAVIDDTVDPAGLHDCGNCEPGWYSTTGLEAFRGYVAQETRTPIEDVDAQVTMVAQLPADITVDDALGERVTSSQIIVYAATLPSRAVVRSVTVNVGGSDWAQTMSTEEFVIVTSADEPFVVGTMDGVLDRELIVAPGAQRVTLEPQSTISGERQVIELTDGIGVLPEGMSGIDLRGFEVVVDSGGRTTSYDGVDVESSIPVPGIG